MAYHPIENYGVIGDLHTVALVGMHGAIDFMCFPHFDSPSIFLAMLDQEKGGTFQLAPLLEKAQPKQIYLPDTNILLTRFLSEEGVAEISDFMPIEVEHPTHSLVRRVKTVRGEVRFRMRCAPRFNYARSPHRVEKRKEGVLFLPQADVKTALFLRIPVPYSIHNGDAVAEFTLRAGETATFLLGEVQEEIPVHSEKSLVTAFKETVNFWRRWIGQSKYKGRWREMVNRSALALKLLTSQPYGSIVAAPTFGLPETIGGDRNWDYRYTWIRDASFTLYGLIRLGFTAEAEQFMHWLEQCCKIHSKDGPLQILVRLDGQREIREEILPHLEGYRRSAPVRIGNDAYRQLQLDIYGELMDAVYLANKYGQPIGQTLWEGLTQIINWVCDHWREPDEGIWEVRGGKRKFLYSKLMCWVALDRAVRLAEKRSFPAPREKWLSVRDAIYSDIFHAFYNPKIQAFVQYRGSETLDASTLLMPLVRFISPTDPYWLSTLRAIEHHLVEDSLVYRYRTGRASIDGLSGKEGTFCMCTFWYVEALSRAGDLQRARYFFEKMLGYANHLGLYAEELGPCGEHLGNFPQAFTHLGLISAAFDLNRRLDEAGWSA